MVSIKWLCGEKILFLNPPFISHTCSMEKWTFEPIFVESCQFKTQGLTQNKKVLKSCFKLITTFVSLINKKLS